MAFQVRRGNTTERGTITPAEGEIIYDTLLKKLFVGDASTVGGNAVDTTVTAVFANIDADMTPDLHNTHDIGTSAKKWKEFHGVTFNDGTATITGGVGAGFSSISSTNFVGNISGNVTGDTGGIHTGAVVGDVTGNVLGNVTGDITGDVFDSSGTFKRVDKANPIISNSKISLNDNLIELLGAGNFKLDIGRNNSADGIGLTHYANNLGNTIAYEVFTAESTSSACNAFEYNASRGSVATPLVLQANDLVFSHTGKGHDGTNSIDVGYIGFGIDSSGTIGTGTLPGKIFLTTTTDGGTSTHDATLDSKGTFAITGAMQLAVYADDAARDAAIASPAAGMTVFNTTGTKFQGYTGAAWVNLN